MNDFASYNQDDDFEHTMFCELQEKLKKQDVEYSLVEVDSLMTGAELTSYEEERFGPAHVDKDFWLVVTQNKPILKAWFKARDYYSRIILKANFPDRPIMKAWREGQIAGGYYDNR